MLYTYMDIEQALNLIQYSQHF